VIVTSHQGYLTENALVEIATTSCRQALSHFQDQPIPHLLER
jgi:lactate dehydrogenase-like 2-hydroxyacid dehydrogenase